MCKCNGSNKKTAEEVAVGVASATIKGMFRLTAGLIRGTGKTLVFVGNAIAASQETKEKANA